MGVRKPQIELFQTQTQGTMLITSPGRYNVLTLPVTTTEAGQRVKLDSMVSISYTTLQLATQYGFEILYFLLRNGGTISSMRSRLVETKPNDTQGFNGDIFPNLTWVDVPPGPGTFNYQVQIFTSSTTNLLSLTAETRSLNATVFPPEL